MPESRNLLLRSRRFLMLQDIGVALALVFILGGCVGGWFWIVHWATG